MAAIIEADLGAPSARAEWLQEGLQVAFDRFVENHDVFMRHFPLDLEREEFYGSTEVDEAKLFGTHLSKPFEVVADATANANKAGLTTDDFKTIVDKLTEFAKVISTLPADREQPPGESRQNSEHRIPDIPVISPDDRINSPSQPVSAKKRTLLTGFGFFVQVLSVASGIATLAATEAGQQFISALQESIAALEKFVQSLPK
jgi:hypothetical protein